MLSHHSTVEGLAVAWFERPAYGKTNRPPLLMVPGLGMTWRSLHWLLAQLPYDRRILVVHPPGAPGTAVIDDMSAQGQAEQLARWSETEQLPAVDLLGHSFGCFVVARLAAVRPALARTLTLVSPAPDDRWSRLWRHVVAFCVGSAREDWHTAPQAVADYLRADPRVLRGYTSELGSTPTQLMAGVEAPTLTVRGTDDTVSSQSWCARIAAAAPEGRTATIRRGAHGLPQDDPRSLAHLLSIVGGGPLRR